jgi:hypothetical protein
VEGTKRSVLERLRYEYMPDGSWKGAGTCTRTVAGGDKMYETWQESSDLKNTRTSTPVAPAN